MKRIVSLALAGVIAAGSVATLVAPASADDPRHFRHVHQGYHGPGPGPGYGRWHGGGGGGWNAGGAFVGGTVLGLALGATMYSPPPPPPAYVYVAPPPPPVVYPRYVYAGDAHIAWCTQHYATYNGETDTFVGYDGITYRCVGPY